jgi:hypothetical protein
VAKTVMVIPNTPVRRILRKKERIIPKDLSLHEQNWVFAQQFSNVAPSDRLLVTVPVNGSLKGDFGPAIRKAAALAERNGVVILFTGHGCRAACTGGQCQFGPAPSSFGFETLPETSEKTKKIDARVLKFLEVAERQGEGWVPKAQKMPGTTTIQKESQSTIDALLPKWETLDVMRDAFTTNGTDRFILLTCSVGTFPKECQALANLINATVVAYTDKIATNEFTPPFDEPPGMMIRPVQCWCTAPPNTPLNPVPDHLTKIAQSEHSEKQEAWLLQNWKRHHLFSMIPAGPVVACKPGGNPTNFP